MSFLDNIVLTSVIHATEVSFTEGYHRVGSPRSSSGLSVAIDGELAYVYGDGEVRLDGTHAVFLPEGAEYDIRCTRAGRFAVINFMTAELPEPDGYERFHVRAARETYLRELTGMHKRLACATATSRHENLSSVYKIIAAVISESEKRGYPTPLARALKHLYASLADQTLKTADLAAVAGVSEVYLRRLFAVNLDTTPMEFLRSRRIELAESLLKETALTVTEVAYECGYSSIYHFCRAFRAAVGKTPSEYRMSNADRVL